jgi:phosphatidylserine/phosphatidylglycerophosphate/cardiolipin synthase-like enzyme
MFKFTPIASVLLAVSFISPAAFADDIKTFFNHKVNAPAVQANLEVEIVNFINAANDTIEIAVYDLDLPGIADALVAAKNRGVSVRFITDEDNVIGENEHALSILNAGGVPWIDDTANGSAGSKIQHNKFIVVDSQRVLLGSTNFTQSGIHGDLNSNGDLISEGNDNHIVTIESVGLANQFTQQFNVMWGDGPGGELDSLFGLGKPDHKVTTVYTTNDNIRLDVQFTPQSPTVYAGSSLDTIQGYIADANSRIYLGQFVISSQDIADSMKLRHEAGVEVQGIGDSSFFFRYYSEFQDMLGVEKPNNHGVPETDSFTDAENNPWSTPADVRVAELMGGDKWHHKYIVMDDVVLTGSHNLSGAAAFGNDENIVVIFDKQTADEFVGHFSYAYCLAGNETGCEQPAYEDGVWEGVYLTGQEIATILDIANNATLAQLDDDAAMNKRAAKNIVSARPIADMQELVDVSYVGSAAVTDLKDYITQW